MPLRFVAIFSLLFLCSLVGCEPSPPSNNSIEEEDVTTAEDQTPIAELSFQTLEDSEEKLITEIRSRRGIGRGSILAPGRSWPAEVILHLHLKGLESLVVEADGVKWEVNVSSSHGHTITSRLNDLEQSISKDKAIVYVMPNQQPVTTIPLSSDQFFEVVLPSQLFESNPSEIKLAWVDFYR